MPLPEKHQIKDRYDQLGGELYDTRYTEEQNEKYKHFLTHLGWGISLDNGCGTGLFLPKTHEYSVGSDISIELLREARKRLGEHQNLVQADSENLPFRPNAFDNMISVTVIQNVPSPKAMVLESSRVTKPGGTLIFSSLKRVYTEETFRELFKVEDIDIQKIYTTEKINDWIAVTKNTL